MFMFSGGIFIIGGGFPFRGVDPLALGAGATFTAGVPAAPASGGALVADESALSVFFFCFAGGPVISGAGKAESGPEGG